MKVLKLAAIVIIPIVIGFLASLTYSSGALERWKLVTSPSENELDYLSMVMADPQHFYAEIPSDEVFRKVVQACDTSNVEFSILSNKPKQMSECVQVLTYHIDGHDRFSIVRDQNGNISEWHSLFTAIKDMGNVFWPVVGLILGLILMLVFRKKILANKR